jgi:hypothetical protein
LRALKSSDCDGRGYTCLFLGAFSISSAQSSFSVDASEDRRDLAARARAWIKSGSTRSATSPYPARLSASCSWTKTVPARGIDRCEIRHCIFAGDQPLEHRFVDDPAALFLVGADRIQCHGNDGGLDDL